jgi:hypothetical protein
MYNDNISLGTGIAVLLMKVKLSIAASFLILLRFICEENEHKG